MKPLFLLTLLLLAGSKAFAQTGSNPPPLCGIYYDYDAAGQRTKRSYDCRQQGNGGPTLPPIGDPTALTIRVYPNPTAGPYTIELQEAPQEVVHYHWYTPDGQILNSGLISEHLTHGDISAWADGTYILAVFLPAGPEAIRVVKLTR